MGFTATENVANNASSALSAGITSAATSLSVVSAASFPSTGNFHIIVDSEIISVQSVSGGTFSSLLRGQEGTTAVAHSVGAPVSCILTANSLALFAQQNGQANYGPGSQSKVLDGVSNAYGLVLVGGVYYNDGGGDLTFENLTINTGVTVVISTQTGIVFRLFVSGTLTNNGTIKCVGGAATGGTPAAAATYGTVNGGAGGAAGGIGAGAVGGAVPYSLGGNGGAGGAGSSGAGGAGGVATQTPVGNVYATPQLLTGVYWDPQGGAFRTLGAGAGGGAGAGDGTHVGGAGGNGGGHLLVCARIFDGAGTYDVSGGNGGAGAGGNAGGGGGGGGGIAMFLIGSQLNTWNPNVVVNGGNGGAGVGTGIAGGAGGAGAQYYTTA